MSLNESRTSSAGERSGSTNTLLPENLTSSREEKYVLALPAMLGLPGLPGLLDLPGVPGVLALPLPPLLALACSACFAWLRCLAYLA